MEENATPKFGVWEWFKSIVLIIFIIIVMGILSIYAALSGVFDSIAKPEIKYGEFPLRIVCEVNGEERIIEEVVVCEYDGIVNRGEGGKRRVWKSYLQSGKIDIILMKIDEYSSLACTYERAEYYMMDEALISLREYRRIFDSNLNSNFIALQRYDETGKSIYLEDLTSEEAYELYGFKLISWEPSPPIQNVYK